MRGVVFGAFSPLHYGHLRLFRACREHCDHLTVVVHSDARVEQIKGFTPEPQAARATDLLDVKTVDMVVHGDTRTKREWAELLRADVLFVGPETEKAPWPGKTVWLPRTPGISSTLLRQLARESAR